MATQEVKITDRADGVQHVHIISISNGAVASIAAIITPASIGAATALDLDNVFSIAMDALNNTQAMTAAEAEAGTVTELRAVSPKVLHDEIARQIAAAG